MSNITIYREGYLQKAGKRSFQAWKKRWFVLQGTVVKYYPSQDTSEVNVLGVIDMSQVDSVIPNRHLKNGIEIVCKSRTYHVSAKSDDERNEWIMAMKKAVNEARRLSVLAAAATLKRNQEASVDHSYDMIGASSSQTSESGMYSEITSSPSQPDNNLYDVIPEKNLGAALYSVVEPGVRPAISRSDARRSSPPGYIPVAPSPNEGVQYDSPKHARVGYLRETVDDSGSDDDSRTGKKINNLLSKFSMESLGSLGDSEEDVDSTDETRSETDATSTVIFPPPQSENYAVKDLSKILGTNENGQFDLKKLAVDYKLKLDPTSEYPMFDALKKFLEKKAVARCA